jgi:hypothetical protein
MAFFYRLTFWGRFLIALPFMLVGNGATWLIACFYYYFTQPDWWGNSVGYVTVVCGFCWAIQNCIKPPQGMIKIRLPKRQKVSEPATTVLTAPNGGKAPSISAISRLLPKELQQVVRAPIDRQPEAIAFENRVASQHKAAQQEAAQPRSRAVRLYSGLQEPGSPLFSGRLCPSSRWTAPHAREGPARSIRCAPELNRSPPRYPRRPLFSMCKSTNRKQEIRDAFIPQARPDLETRCQGC